MYIVNTKLRLSLRYHKVLGQYKGWLRVYRYYWVVHELVSSYELTFGVARIKGILDNVTIGLRTAGTWDWTLLLSYGWSLVCTLGWGLTKTSSRVHPVGIGVHG